MTWRGTVHSWNSALEVVSGFVPGLQIPEGWIIAGPRVGRFRCCHKWVVLHVLLRVAYQTDTHTNKQTKGNRGHPAAVAGFTQTLVHVLWRREKKFMHSFTHQFIYLFLSKANLFCHFFIYFLLKVLTLLSLLPEWNHLIELSLYQPVSLLLIQPFTTREGLLDPCERTIHHHLPKKPRKHGAELTHGDLPDYIVCIMFTYLLAVPPSTDSIVVMSNGDSAEGAEERSNLHIKDVCQATLKLSSLQKHLDQKQHKLPCLVWEIPTCERTHEKFILLWPELRTANVNSKWKNSNKKNYPFVSEQNSLFILDTTKISLLLKSYSNIVTLTLDWKWRAPSS